MLSRGCTGAIIIIIIITLFKEGNEHFTAETDKQVGLGLYTV